jgi:hypothetical protein
MGNEYVDRADSSSGYANVDFGFYVGWGNDPKFSLMFKVCGRLTG